MRVLVTGSSGVVGTVVSARLLERGHEVVRYDLAEPVGSAAHGDVLDAEQLARASSSADIVVHLAAVDDAPEAHADLPAELMPPSLGSPEAVVATTVLGTQNVLAAAHGAGHARVVVMSSVDALGVFLGQRPPDYLPIDEAHPTYPRSPYALAKRVAERACAAFTKRTGVATLCLRPPGVFTPDTFDFIRRRFAEDPLNDRRPFWEYGAFIALSDLGDAVACAVAAPFTGHAIVHVCANDAALAEQTSRDAAKTIHPDVPFRGGPAFRDDPFHTLLDNRAAKALLGWEPATRFRP